MNKSNSENHSQWVFEGYIFWSLIFSGHGPVQLRESGLYDDKVYTHTHIQPIYVKNDEMRSGILRVQVNNTRELCGRLFLIRFLPNIAYCTQFADLNIPRIMASVCFLHPICIVSSFAIKKRERDKYTIQAHTWSIQSHDTTPINTYKCV